MPQLNIYPEAGMGGETVVGSDDVSHHVMSQESFVNGEKSEDSDVPSYQLGLSAQELNDPAKIVVTIADKQTPVVVLFGSPSCGKTMTLVRLTRYLHSLGYTVDPVRSFRPAFDSHYAEMCDTFSRTVNSDEAAESTRFMNFMLVIVRKDGRPVCQILEAPGEYYFNPKNPGMQFPPYVQAIISATNRKIWGIMLEPDWMNASDRANYVDRIRMVNRNRRSYDRAIFIYNKIDRLPGLTMGTGRVNSKYAMKDIMDNYVGLFDIFRNAHPITRWWRKYDCDFVPFQTGTYHEAADKTLMFQAGPDEYPAMLWQKIMAYL